MRKIQVQPYQVPKRMKCNLCDRVEKVEKRLVIWHNKQVIGDLHLCNPCLLITDGFRGATEVSQQWDFAGGE